jgi:hypothetical protein
MLIAITGAILSPIGHKMSPIDKRITKSSCELYIQLQSFSASILHAPSGLPKFRLGLFNMSMYIVKTDTQLEALKRIVSQVSTFRSEPENLERGAYGKNLSDYLEQRLEADDWVLWQSLQIDWKYIK